MRRRQILAQREQKKEAAKPAAYFLDVKEHDVLIDGKPCPCCHRIFHKRGRKKA